MRTTITIDDKLLEEALRLVPADIKRFSAHSYVVNAGLKALISQEAVQRLSNLAGSMPDFVIADRNR